ncbi:chloramphenicol phosphotransferase CPT family protein [Archangium primigenium]|uniref:chloramphenicol phosphotransferase CPT family protein n=1 Tax=[Archangium] primigenium TaxID=2792470 RepID=UPI001956712D|nr:AAA family ATPase [Archangium primigenium]MBM7116402.1 AAA family ATPase [Archangium primigenium]
MSTSHARIIYLNGPSSAGKSSIARVLQARLPEPYLHIGIDHLIALMPAHLNDWETGRGMPGFGFRAERDAGGVLRRELQIGPYGRKMVEAYVAVVAELARLGHGLIVDDVAIRPGDTEDEWAPAFAGRRVLRVGVTASLEVLERREAARGDRPPGSARAQKERIHYDARYDLVVDTAERDVEACAAEILAAALR